MKNVTIMIRSARAINAAALGVLAGAAVFVVPVSRAQPVPLDPAVRFQGFQPRLGTTLSTDRPQWWNFDNANRGEAQDAFWRIYEPARERTDPSSFTFVTEPNYVTGHGGTTPQEYRDSVIRVVNLARYVASDVGAVYATEDPSKIPAAQAAAFLMARNRRASHNPDPSWIGYNELAAQGARGQLVIGANGTEAILTFLSDYGPHNISVGHRDSLLSNATLIATGDVQGGDLLPANSIQLGNFIDNPRSGDPMDHTRVWPARGYFPYQWVQGDYLVGTSDGVRVSVHAAHQAIARFDQVSVAVTRDGVPVPVKVIERLGDGANRLVFEIPGAEFATAPARDVTFDVTVGNLVFHRPNQWRHPVYYPNDTEPAAGTYETQRSLEWSFTVYDPARTEEAPRVTQSPVVNLSTRARVGAGEQVLIGGFVVTGNEPLRVVLRALGPTLRQYGLNSAGNPRLELFDMRGASPAIVGTVEDFRSEASWRLVQSYQLTPSDEGEVATVATLPPGNYTAVVSDAAGSTGIGIMEIYAADTFSSSRLTNVSTRGYVGEGAELMIGGFVLQSPRTMVIRAQGPSLAAYGIVGSVADTRLALYRGQERIVENDDWDVAANAQLKSAGWAYLRPQDARESALVVSLPAGRYTVHLEGKASAKGIGIIEIFDVTP